MIVLGLNAFGHDAAAVLLRDGKPVFASSQERYDRIRHSPAFPTQAIEAALSRADLRPTDVDHIAFPWTRDMGRLAKAWHVLRHLPRSRAYFREPPDTLLPDRRGYLRAMRGVEQRLRSVGLDAPLTRVPHHRAHAASAALSLPGATGAILTADGMGEWTTAAAWTAHEGRLVRRARAVYPHSPGKAYAAVTQWLGWRPESSEGKTMGLAAYGRPDAAGTRFTRGLLTPDPARLVRVDTQAFGFPWGHARLYGDAFLAALGPPRPPGPELRPGDADAARGIQEAVEAMALANATQLLAETGAACLGLAGGLFLNCALNGKLQRALEVPVHPFPVAGDAGAGRGGRRAQEHPGDAGAVRVEREPGPADQLQAAVRPAGDVAADVVGVVGLERRGRPDVLGDDPVVKMMGLGLATAILVDATVVRIVLVPATMKLVGDANWWLPGWLDRLLPTVDIDGGPGEVPEPALDEPALDDETVQRQLVPAR